ncbi:dihydroorotate dehydrogenase electron transfer subunit [Candidatus Woesearchaeota archaeon]|nr:dihydroorotate dehydrogenase electron transfer subunit [Candidatus Woesearchaeota archaeon]
MERPKIIRISGIKDEAEGIKTIFLRHSMVAKPGQFVMLWIPGIDEKPFAVSYSDQKKGEIGLTVAAVGPFSNRLSSMKEGDKVGIRGPYGRGYNLGKNSKQLVMAGGGYGSASLTMLAEEAVSKGCNVKFILGARSKARLVYADRIKKLLGSGNLIITTDDGSAGIKGFVTDALKNLFKAQKVDRVYACGPDRMLKAVSDICNENKIDCEVSIERYMKCGFGLCGHCCVDPIGIRACAEGPVISSAQAAKISELGSYHRVKSSRKEKL